MDNRKSELLSFIGVNTKLITDLISLYNSENPDIEVLSDLLKLYQENEVYRNELEALMNKAHSALTWEFIEYKHKHEGGIE